MASELFFIYDTHCPWSYVTTPLVKAIQQALPQISIHLWHSAYFSATDESQVTKKQLDEITLLTDARFSDAYIANIDTKKNSTLSANLMTWVSNKNAIQAFDLLTALQQAHFEQGNELTTQSNVSDIIEQLKLSPPAKVFKADKLSNDAHAQIEEIFALQEIIQTEAIPALLLAIDDDLILLNHHLYLKEPQAIVEAVQLELNKYK
jgi:protein-disulfide isomerase-like protein with CxxC motif